MYDNLKQIQQELMKGCKKMQMVEHCFPSCLFHQLWSGSQEAVCIWLIIILPNHLYLLIPEFRHDLWREKVQNLTGKQACWFLGSELTCSALQTSPSHSGHRLSFGVTISHPESLVPLQVKFHTKMFLFTNHLSEVVFYQLTCFSFCPPDLYTLRKD